MRTFWPRDKPHWARGGGRRRGIVLPTDQSHTFWLTYRQAPACSRYEACSRTRDSPRAILQGMFA
eukprot:scaffold2871_cov381-Prasinococcus_capsulatus_cf.AAC.14